MNLTEGPIWNDEDGNLPEEVPHCAWGADQCTHLGIHDYHYFYCSAQDAENKHGQRDGYAYPWPGAGKQLLHNEPDGGCPYLKTKKR